MSEHVVERLADYVEGRLAPAEHDEVKRHLDACADCSADAAFATRLRQHGIDEGLRHLAAERLVALATDGSAEATEAEQQHLRDCAECSREHEWLRTKPGDEAWESIQSAGGQGEGDTGGSGGGSQAGPGGGAHGRTIPLPKRRNFWRRAGPGLLAAAAVVAVAVLVPRLTDDGQRWRSMAIVEPIEVRVVRGPVSPGSFEALRVQGLEAYQQGDYAAARDVLQNAAQLRPDDAEVLLYLGSAHLLLGDAESSSSALRRGASDSPNDVVREENLWQLANAELVRGDLDAAREALSAVVALSGRRASAAERLLKQIGP